MNLDDLAEKAEEFRARDAGITNEGAGLRRRRLPGLRVTPGLGCA